MMEFDLFDKLSELETEIHILKKELESKDAYIEQLMNKNTDLERQLLSLNHPKYPKVYENGDATGANSATSIADILKETSESVIHSTGYTFDGKTGLYYDQNSGYYYDPDNKLFYEPRSGIYYEYNSETNEYIYHSKTDEEYLYIKFKQLVSDPTYQHLLKVILMMSSDSSFDHVFMPGMQKKPIISQRDQQQTNQTSRSRNRSSSNDGWSRHRSRSRSSSYDYKLRGKHRKRSSRHKHSHKSERKFHKRHRSYSSSESYHKRKSYKHLSSRRARRERSHSKSDSSYTHEKSVERNAKSPVTTIPTAKSVCGEPVVYPPCIRLMVLASDHVIPGHVFILTSQECLNNWGCIGRCSSLCPSATIPNDENVDDIHCELIYDDKKFRYYLTDRNSTSGTYLNGIVLKKKQKCLLDHGDIIRVGSSRLLVHIHEGQETCGQCDPDEVKAALEALKAMELNELIVAIEESNQLSNEPSLFMSDRDSRDSERRDKLNELKDKYGLRSTKLPSACSQPKESARDSLQHSVSKSDGTSSNKYLDRAAQRRAHESNVKSSVCESAPLTAGITTTDISTDKTDRLDRASIYKPIGAENKGAQLLAKMGWTPGRGLGKNLTGISEPITVGMRSNPQAGLGSQHSGTKPFEHRNHRLTQSEVLAKTRERFDKL